VRWAVGIERLHGPDKGSGIIEVAAVGELIGERPDLDYLPGPG
jgi:hypothetical protein